MHRSRATCRMRGDRQRGESTVPRWRRAVDRTGGSQWPYQGDVAVHGGVWNLGAYPRPRCGAPPLGSRHDGRCRLPGRLGALREHDELIGPVASIVIAWRAVEATAAPGLRAMPPAVAAARAKVWTASPPGVGCETTSEPLAAMLRPGNAESNDADHRLELLDRAIDGLPAVYQADHDVRTTLVRSSTRSWCVPSRPGPPTGSSWSSSRPTATTPSATR